MTVLTSVSLTELIQMQYSLVYAQAPFPFFSAQIIAKPHVEWHLNFLASYKGLRDIEVI